MRNHDFFCFFCRVKNEQDEAVPDDTASNKRDLSPKSNSTTPSNAGGAQQPKLA